MSYEHINLLCMGCFSRLESEGAVCHYCGYDNAAQSVPTYQLPPRTILGGKYMLGKVLGEGGFGITYVAYDLNLDVLVAVKEYYPTGLVTRTTTESMTVRTYGGEHGDFFRKGRERFVDEAKRLALFRVLPGIVAVNDFLAENGTAYIVMEFVKGQTLKSYIAEKGGKLSPEQVFAMMEPVFGSLAQIHESGIIHRDISPDNIMVTPDGSVKLLDFGAARKFEDSGNKSLSVMLKHGYAPMEQYTSKGHQGPYTDVYALSATIYKALTGVTPEGSMDRVMEDTVVPPSRLGVILLPHQETALMKGLAVRQGYRYQTATALHAALYGAQDVDYGRQHGQYGGQQASQGDTVNTSTDYGTLHQPETLLTENSVRNIGMVLAVPVLIIVVAIIILINQSDVPVEDYAPSIDWAAAEDYTSSVSIPTPAPTPEPTPVPTPMPTPEPEPVPEVITSPMVLFETVAYSSNWIQINVYLPNSNPIVFERDRNSAVWTMLSADGSLRLVSPEITQNGRATTLSHATPPSVFNFNAETTGTISGELGNHTFSWDAVTCSAFSKGSISGVNNVHNFRHALVTYPLISITVTWDEAERGTTAFYRDNSGNWYVRSRFGWFTQTVANLYADGDTIHMMLTRVGRQDYLFYSDGSGWFNDQAGDLSSFRYTFNFHMEAVR